jgi:hypothetical protein
VFLAASVTFPLGAANPPRVNHLVTDLKDLQLSLEIAEVRTSKLLGEDTVLLLAPATREADLAQPGPAVKPNVLEVHGLEMRLLQSPPVEQGAEGTSPFSDFIPNNVVPLPTGLN